MLDCDNLEEEFVVGVLDSGIVKTTTKSFLLPSFDVRNLSLTLSQKQKYHCISILLFYKPKAFPAERVPFPGVMFERTCLYKMSIWYWSMLVHVLLALLGAAVAPDLHLLPRELVVVRQLLTGEDLPQSEDDDVLLSKNITDFAVAVWLKTRF